MPVAAAQESKDTFRLGLRQIFTKQRSMLSSIDYNLACITTRFMLRYFSAKIAVALTH